MLELANPSIGFIASLLKNKDPPPSERFPGGSGMCLKILAFWLSWVRKLHCKTHELRLSQKILDELDAWSKCSEGLQEGGAEEAKDASGDMPLYRSKDELELAQKLFEDFSRFGPAEDGSAVSGMDSSKGAGSSASTSASIATATSSNATATTAPAASASVHKERGNKLFRAKDYNGAIEAYTQGLEEVGEDAALRAKLLSNRAKAKLKTKAERGPIVDDLDAAIKADPSFLRPYLTKAEIQFQAGSYDDCRKTVERGKTASGSSPSSSSDAKIVKSLESLDRKCIMAGAFEVEGESLSGTGTALKAATATAAAAAGAAGAGARAGGGGGAGAGGGAAATAAAAAATAAATATATATATTTATTTATASRSGTTRKAKEEDLIAAILARSGGGGGDDDYGY